MHAMNNSTAYFARAVSYARKKVRKSTQKINITFLFDIFFSHCLKRSTAKTQNKITS